MNYKLDIDLPFPVNGDDGDAKFDKSKHLLTITLPVSIPREDIPKYVKPEDVITEEEEQSTIIQKTPIVEQMEQKSIIEVVEPSKSEPLKEISQPIAKPKKSVSFQLEQKEEVEVKNSTEQLYNSIVSPKGEEDDIKQQSPIEPSTFKQYNIEFSNKYVFELD